MSMKNMYVLTKAHSVIFAPQSMLDACHSVASDATIPVLPSGATCPRLKHSLLK